MIGKNETMYEFEKGIFIGLEQSTLENRKKITHIKCEGAQNELNAPLCPGIYEARKS